MRQLIIYSFLFFIISLHSKAQLNINIHTIPTPPIINANPSTTVEIGESIELSVNNCQGNVTWSTGENGNSIFFYPWHTNPITITANCESNLGCVSGSGSISVGGQISPPTINGIQNPCFEEEVTLRGSNCSGIYRWYVYDQITEGEYLWLGNVRETFRVSMTCVINGSESPRANFNVIPSLPVPPPTIHLQDIGPVAIGSTVSITATGCPGIVNWNNGQQGNTIQYLVTESNPWIEATCGNGGCSSQAAILTIETFVAPPRSQNASVCESDIATLTAYCGSNETVTWYDPFGNNIGQGNHISVNAEIGMNGTQYNVHCVHNNLSWPESLSEPTTVTLTVFPKPDPPIFYVSDSIINYGDSINVYSTDTLEFENHGFSNNWFTKPILNNTTIRARQFSENGCPSTWSEKKIYLRPDKPIVKSSEDSICVGNNIVLQAQCNSKVIWSTNDTTNYIIVNPIKTTTYSAFCIDSLGIKSLSTNIIITVFDKPESPEIITEQTTILEGEEIRLTAFCEGNNQTYWSNGETTNSIYVSPLLTTTYYAQCVNPICESGKTSIVITVKPSSPIITDETGNIITTDSICFNDVLTYNAKCESNSKVVWLFPDNQILNGQNQAISGDKNHNYQVYCENSNGIKSEPSQLLIISRNISVADINIYPNPTERMIYIRSNGCLGQIKIDLYTQFGDHLYSGFGTKIQPDIISIDLGRLPSQVYILRISGNEGNRPIFKEFRVSKSNQ